MDDKSIKNQNTVFILACVLSFVMGCYFFNIIQQKTTNVGGKTTTVQTRVISPILTGTEATTGVKLSTSTNVLKTNTNLGNKNVYQKPVKPILIGSVSAGYDGDSEYERVRNQIIKLGVSYEIAEHITREAYTNTSGGKQFVKAIIGVSNAEGSIFKRGMYNNYLGVMLCSNGECHLRKYNTVQEAITHWREMYNRNKRYLRTTPGRWLAGNYCASECIYWVQNYNEGVYLLNI